MSRAERLCCDGQCTQGRACPLVAGRAVPARQIRFAPGVIDGPARRPGLVRRLVARLRPVQP